MRLLDIVAPIAERQLGNAARHQILAEGVSPDTLDGAVQRGHLVVAERAVYAVPGAPKTAESRLAAIALAAGPGALVSHESAAWKWSLRPAPARHHLTVPRGREFTRRGVEVHHSGDLHLASAGTIGGVPVTGIGRTILDCAIDPCADVQRLVDAARREHHISPTLLPSVLVEHARRGRPGVAHLRRFLLVDGIPDSDFERLVMRWLRDLGIDGWEHHHRVVAPGHGPVEIDIAWPDRKVAWELEGAVHRRGSAVHDRDTARQNALVLDGWMVLRTTYPRWLRRTEDVRAEVDAALSRRDR